MAVIGNNQTSPDDSLTKVVEGKPGTSAVRLNQLRYFVAAVDYGSLRKAAAALSVQESSISRRIRDLEDELGASLFMRHAGGVRLTVAGREFKPDQPVGFFRLAEMEMELSRILGRKVDLRTPMDLSRYFRQDVLNTAEVQYAEG